jgi:protein SCO1/2
VAKRILIAACIFLGAALILLLNWPGMRAQPAPAPVSVNVGGAFHLSDVNGAPVTDDILKGHYSLVYFGYTRCPDVCPLALQKMTEALQIAGPPAESVLPIFITVDPEHDTGDVMKAYISNFHPRFVALTGTPEAVKQAQAAYHIYAAKMAGADAKNAENTPTTRDDAAKSGTIAHSDTIYLMGPDGKYVTQFASATASGEIATQLRRVLHHE